MAGSLKWILGRPRPSDTAGPSEAEWFAKQPHFGAPRVQGRAANGTWQAGQHNANIIPAVAGGVDGLLMFDNGARTGGKTDQPSPSRLLRYDITARPTASTLGVVSQTFEFNNSGWEGLGRSPFLGGARRLANGNYLGQFGALTQPSCNAPCERDLNDVCMYTRVVEITPSGELVFAAHVGGRDTSGQVGAPPRLLRAAAHSALPAPAHPRARCALFGFATWRVPPAIVTSAQRPPLRSHAHSLPPRVDPCRSLATCATAGMATGRSASPRRRSTRCSPPTSPSASGIRPGVEGRGRRRCEHVTQACDST